MRAAFVRTLVELAGKDDRILLLTGDLGYMALEPFAEKYPRRFFNVGVAEDNMTGIATGLAEAGFIPYVYSITPFSVLRPYEFIRNGPILHQLPVRIVGMGGGFEYAGNGATHYGLEDIGVLRVQPGISLIAPADCAQTASALQATWNLPGPVYYRLGKDDRLSVPNLNGSFQLGRTQQIRPGTDLCFIVMGSIAVDVMRAADILESRGVRCAVVVLACVSPAPAEDLREILRRFKSVVTVEVHYVNGGVGSLVAELAAESRIPCRLLRCGIRTLPDGVTGSQPYLYRRHGLDSDSLVRKTLQFMSDAQEVPG